MFFYHSTPLYCDNKNTIQIVCNSIFHDWTKHIEINYHVTRHHYQCGTITLHFILSCVQITDMFIKTHSSSRFHLLFNKLSMLLAVASWVWGGCKTILFLFVFSNLKGRLVFLYFLTSLYEYFYYVILFNIILNDKP